MLAEFGLKTPGERAILTLGVGFTVKPSG